MPKALSRKTRAEVRAGRAALRIHAAAAKSPEVNKPIDTIVGDPVPNYPHTPPIDDPAVPVPDQIRQQIDYADHLWQAVYQDPNPLIRACRVVRTKAPREFDALMRLVVETIQNVPLNRGDPNGQVTENA